ncbi:MAG TPA: hypothetical protein VLI94_05800 [Solirubrobacterales bacterium]|nr:hypothetical protein [Solirubrobacterales bacterium]
MVFLVAALGAQGIGCGSSDEPAVISRADFVAKANRICADTVEKQAAAFRRIGDEMAGRQLTTAEVREKEDQFGQEVVVAVEAMVDELEGLGAPAGEEEAVAKMLDRYERGAEAAASDARVFLTGKAFLEADTSAKSLGLSRCEGI